MKHFIQQAIIGEGVSSRAGLVARVLERPDRSSGAITRYQDPSIEFGVATGNAVVGDDGRTYWQITLYKPYVFDKAKGKYHWATKEETDYKRTAWVYANVDFAKQKVEFKEDLDSDQVVHAIILNDNNTVSALNHAGQLMALKERQGVDVAKFKKQHADIYERVRRRRANLARQGVKFEEKEPSTWTKFKNFFGFNGLGEPITITVCLILVVVALIAGGALFYWVFWPDYEDSKYDIQETAEMVAILEKLNPEDRQKVEEFYNAEANKAYQTGKTEGEWGNTFSLLKYAAVGVGAIWLVGKVSDSKGK